MSVEGFEDTNCPLCGNFDPEPWAGHLVDAVIAWRKDELKTGSDSGLYDVRELADKIIANRDE